jgi:hypothetical protein
MIVVLVIGAATLWAEPSPTSQPAGQTSIKLTTQSSIDEILDALDADGKQLKDFTADVKQTDIDRAAGDSSSSSGTVIFQMKAPGDDRLRVVFTKKSQGGKSKPTNHEYTLDNGHLIERDYLEKTEDDQQISQPGEKMDLLSLNGKFPLPIGQDKDSVKSLFAVQIVASAMRKPPFDDPPNTVHIILKPLPGTKYAQTFNSLDLWVDLLTSMPRKLVQTPYSKDGSANSLKATELTNWKLNVGLTDKDFQEPETKGDWDKKKELLKGQ